MCFLSSQACMDECKSRNCKVIQYDCGTHCWLLDNCGSETEPPGSEDGVTKPPGIVLDIL